MVNLTELAGFAIIITGVVLLTGFVAGVDLPGNPTTNPSDGEPRYDVSAEVGVSAAAVQSEPVIEEDSFIYTTQESGLFNFNVADSQALSLLKVENVRVFYTLEGQGVTVTGEDDLGDIGRLQDTKTSTFNAANLPAGTYTLNVEAVSDQGTDTAEFSVEVPKQ